jgi:hypothetical protein
MPRFRAFALAVFALGVVLRLPSFGRAMLSDDEAIYATTADAMARGDLLYRDVVDHKPPLIYHAYQAGFAAFGAYNTHGAHLLVLLAVLLTAGFLFAIHRDEDAADARWIGLAAAALFLIFSTTWHDYDALAANCELFLLAPQAAAAWLLLRGIGRASQPERTFHADRPPHPDRLPAHRAEGTRDAATHLGVGVLIGVSALFKYQGVTFLGASIGLAIWWSILGRASWSRTAARALCHLAGALLPPVLYLAWCAAAGNAEAAIGWFRFNFSYVGAGLTGLDAVARGARRLALIGGTAIVPYALGIAAAVYGTADMARVIRRRLQGAPASDEGAPPPSVALGVLWLVTSAISVSAGGRFFGHYFHLVLAPLCLLAATAVHRIWHQGWAHRAPLAALCALPALAFFGLATIARPVAGAIDEREPRYDEVAARIAELTTPDERIFVWGNSMQLYVLARRPMGARFSFCNYMTGESPGTPTETGARDADANQLAAAWGMLFDDLERRRPALFVDAAAAGWDGYGKYPLDRYLNLRAYVDQHYRQVDVRAGVVLYRRLR